MVRNSSPGSFWAIDRKARPASRLQTAASSGAQAVRVQVLSRRHQRCRATARSNLFGGSTRLSLRIVVDSTLQQRTMGYPDGSCFWRLANRRHRFRPGKSSSLLRMKRSNCKQGAGCLDSTLIHLTERCRSRTVPGWKRFTRSVTSAIPNEAS
jgi:hypothetical protein